MDLFEKKALSDIKEAINKWQKDNRAEFDKDRKVFVTESGIPIKRVYTPLDLAEKNFDYLKDLGLPGEYPYTRFNRANGYRSEL